MRMRHLLGMVGVAVAAACKGDGGGPVGADPSIAGTWSGSAKFGLVDFRATFTQAGDSVGGPENSG